MFTTRHTVLKLVVATGAFSVLGAGPAFAAEPVKVVYHLTEGIDQSAKKLNNIRNHLQADPTAKIVVVSNGEGVASMMSGAMNPKNEPMQNTIKALKEKGVEFRACNNTLTQRNLDPAKLITEAKTVPSGVAEVARLQALECYVCLKP